MITKQNIHAGDLPWRNSAYHVAARYKEVSTSDELQLHYVEVDVGGRILPHAPGQAQLFFCLEGSGTFLLDEEETRCQAGDCLFAPRGRVRGLVNGSTQPLLLLIFQGTPTSWNPLSLLPLLHHLR